MDLVAALLGLTCIKWGNIRGSIEEFVRRESKEEEESKETLKNQAWTPIFEELELENSIEGPGDARMAC